MSSITLIASETALFSGQSVEMQVTLSNDSGTTMTIQDILILGGANMPCEFTKSLPIPATLANGASLVVPFVAVFKAPKQLDPGTKRYLSFDCTAVAKIVNAGAYSESASTAVRVNVINPAYPQSGRINGPNLFRLAANFTSTKRTIALPVVL